MKFHEIRKFNVPSVAFEATIPGVNPETGSFINQPDKPSVFSRIKGILGFKDAPPEEPAAKTGDPFQRKLNQIAGKLGVEASHLLKIMKFETAGTLDPAIQSGTGSGATGLIQFVPAIAKSMGTTTAALSKLTPEQQLDYVYKYYKNARLRPGSSLSDIYLYTYMPAVMQTRKPDTFVLGKKGAYKEKVWDVNLGKNWDQNPAFRNEGLRNKRNYFTVGDVRSVINRK